MTIKYLENIIMNDNYIKKKLAHVSPQMIKSEIAVNSLFIHCYPTHLHITPS